jgi:hypothetical protein
MDEPKKLSPNNPVNLILKKWKQRGIVPELDGQGSITIRSYALNETGTETNNPTKISNLLKTGAYKKLFPNTSKKPFDSKKRNRHYFMWCTKNMSTIITQPKI